MIDKTYILENGILELYLLGELSTKKQLEVETILNTDAELKAIFDKLEEGFEVLAFENTIEPPKEAKDSLMEKVRTSKTKVIPPRTKKQIPYLSIAAGFALLIMAFASIWLLSRVNNMENQLKLVQEEKTELENNITKLKDDVFETNKWFQAINNPDAIQYILKGNALAPNTKVVSYVNHQEKTVVVNVQSLPELDAEHDYQMWADVDGEMINMGVIDKKKDMLAMTYIDRAESLNITIEPSGGNDHPTVSRLVTNVYLDKS